MNQMCAPLSLKSRPREVSLIDATKTFLITPGKLMPIIDESKSGYELQRFQNFKVCEKLQAGIDALTEAPLKPQQKVHLLKYFLLPKIFHSLIFWAANTRRLQTLNIKIRGAVRSWFKGRRDTPTSMFYCKLDDDGLNIPSTEHPYPIMLRGRLEVTQLIALSSYCSGSPQCAT